MTAFAELEVIFGHDERVVKVDFGSNVSSIEMEPAEAIKFANRIIQRARSIQAEGRRSE